jgi:hypothetical protein
MEPLLIIISICSFIANFFLLIAEVTSKSIIVKLLMKTIALFGVITPILYWFKLMNII